MKENEKFEKFAEALREYTQEVNKTALLNGYEERISPGDVDTVLSKLKYYLENQEEVRDALQVALDEYKELLDYGEKHLDDEEFDLDDEWERIDYTYRTIYGNGVLLKFGKNVGQNTICYTYDTYDDYITFGIWNADGGDLDELVRIAVDDKLQFENEEELKDLVVDVADALDSGEYNDEDYDEYDDEDYEE